MIRIVAVGKIKEKALSQLIAEYVKRLSAFTRVEIIEVDEAERDTWKEACDPLYDDWLAEMESLGLDGQAVLDQLQALIEEYHYYEG